MDTLIMPHIHTIFKAFTYMFTKLRTIPNVSVKFSSFNLGAPNLTSSKIECLEGSYALQHSSSIKSGLNLSKALTQEIIISVRLL